MNNAKMMVCSPSELLPISARQVVRLIDGEGLLEHGEMAPRSKGGKCL
jgi:hypothetical protein